MSRTGFDETANDPSHAVVALYPEMSAFEALLSCREASTGTSGADMALSAVRVVDQSLDTLRVAHLWTQGLP
jgi:hypothetical protein